MSFKKSDLLNRDIVTQRNGDKKIYCIDRGGFIGIDNDSYLHYNNYTENLLDEDGDETYDIMKVERAVHYETVFNRDEEVKDMTMTELEKIVGHPFRIVNKKED